MKESVNLWLIWSIEHNAWWKPGHAGYTTNRAEAGVYPEAEAMAIVASANEHRAPTQTPNEAMVFIKNVTVEQKVVDPLNDPTLPHCKECKTQVTFMGVQESIESMSDVETYSCRCGEKTLERPVVDN